MDPKTNQDRIKRAHKLVHANGIRATVNAKKQVTITHTLSNTYHQAFLQNQNRTGYKIKVAGQRKKPQDK